MFFIMGISNGRKEINYDSGGMNICKSCGAYCRYRVSCTYMYMSLFFIPLFKWSKQYYAECSSCGKVFSLNHETGRKIENGEMMTISSDDLEAETTFCNDQYKKCCKCGYDANADFEYCPKCGTKL
mgnify:CR=1 FL=1|jgi:hypothetical protein